MDNATKIRLLGFLLPILIIIGLLLFNNGKQKQFVHFSKTEVWYRGEVVETKQSLPKLFIQPPLELNNNAKYTYTVLGDSLSNQEFIRIDKKVVQTGETWFDNVSAFYTFDSQTRKYKRVLASSEKQNDARFPQTQIIDPNLLTVKFYYDISRPNSCYGYECRSYWADFYKWDSKTSQFKQVNSEYRDFYLQLANQYEEMNKKGCDLGDNKGVGLSTLSDVFKSDKFNYCKGSSREELNRFFELKDNKLPTLTCKAIDERQAVELVKNLPEVKEYLNSSFPSGNNVVINIDHSKGALSTIHVYESVKDNGVGAHSATFNWYTIDRCTGEIKCSFAIYNKGTKVGISDSNEYPCSEAGG